MLGSNGVSAKDNSNKLLGSLGGRWRKTVDEQAVYLRGSVRLPRWIGLSRSSSAEGRERAVQGGPPLLDWGFEHYRTVEVASAETTPRIFPVTDYLDRTVALVVAETPPFPVLTSTAYHSKIDFESIVEAPSSRAAPGTFTVTRGSDCRPVLVADVPVERPDLWSRVRSVYAWSGAACSEGRCRRPRIAAVRGAVRRRRRTPLYDGTWRLARAWSTSPVEMPVQYAGIIEEHTR